MSKIILSIICIIIFSGASAQIFEAEKCVGLKIRPNSNSPFKKDSGTMIRFRCSRVVPTNTRPPLFVVDGIPYEEKDFSTLKLDPNDIKSIDILKEATINAIYGCSPPTGVVIITTKKADERTITIKDFVTDEALEGASVEIISKKNAPDTTRYVADKHGNITTQKIIYGEEYEMNISYVGYRSFKATVNSKLIGKNYTALLSKDFKNMDEVVVVSYPGKRCIRCGHCVLLTKKANSYLNKEPDKPVIKIYPNPAIRSGNVNLEFNSDKQSKLTIQLFNIGNSLINRKEYSTNKGNNKLSFSIDTRLSAGIYFLQVIDENGKLIRTEKLVIQ